MCPTATAIILKSDFICVKLPHSFDDIAKLVVQKVEGEEKVLTNESGSDIIAKLSAREAERKDEKT